MKIIMGKKLVEEYIVVHILKLWKNMQKQHVLQLLLMEKKFIMGFIMRVKPNRIRYSKRKKEYWVLNGTIDEMRPYRIMIKEYKNDSGCALF